MFSLNFMFLCSLIEELCTKEENDKTGCNFNFGHECRIIFYEIKCHCPLVKILATFTLKVNRHFLYTDI